jgi:hypothetical protein
LFIDDMGNDFAGGPARARTGAGPAIGRDSFDPGEEGPATRSNRWAFSDMPITPLLFVVGLLVVLPRYGRGASRERARRPSLLDRVVPIETLVQTSTSARIAPENPVAATGLACIV